MLLNLLSCFLKMKQIKNHHGNYEVYILFLSSELMYQVLSGILLVKSWYSFYLLSYFTQCRGSSDNERLCDDVSIAVPSQGLVLR